MQKFRGFATTSPPVRPSSRSTRDISLGKWDKKTSRAEYDRIIGEWLANGQKLPALADIDLTVTELVAAFVHFALGYYVKDVVARHPPRMKKGRMPRGTHDMRPDTGVRKPR